VSFATSQVEDQRPPTKSEIVVFVFLMPYQTNNSCAKLEGDDLTKKAGQAKVKSVLVLDGKEARQRGATTENGGEFESRERLPNGASKRREEFGARFMGLRHRFVQRRAIQIGIWVDFGAIEL